MSLLVLFLSKWLFQWFLFFFQVTVPSRHIAILQCLHFYVKTKLSAATEDSKLNLSRSCLKIHFGADLWVQIRKLEEEKFWVSYKDYTFIKLEGMVWSGFTLPNVSIHLSNLKSALRTEGVNYYDREAKCFAIRAKYTKFQEAVEMKWIWMGYGYGYGIPCWIRWKENESRT